MTANVITITRTRTRTTTTLTKNPCFKRHAVFERKKSDENPERYIHRKKERKKREKKRRENASVTRKQGDHQRGGSLCVHEEERFSFTRLVLRSRDTSAILFSRSSRARSKVLHFSRGDISRSCEFPPSVLGLDTVEKVVEAGAWSDIGSGDRRSRSRLSPPRKSVEWLRSRTKEIM